MRLGSEASAVTVTFPPQSDRLLNPTLNPSISRMILLEGSNIRHGMAAQHDSSLPPGDAR
jgi:hypothetical protein